MSTGRNYRACVIYSKKVAKNDKLSGIKIKSIGSPPFNERFDNFSNFHECKS